jgi:F-type H+-transporting ATPase subunit b
MIGPPDITFVIQIVSFFALWLGLKRLLFDAVLEVIEKRKARTVGVREEAAQLRLDATQSEAEFDRQMSQVREELGRQADSARHASDAEERQILATARDQAAARLKEQRDQVRTQAESAGAVLAGESASLAAAIVRKVVGEQRA